MVRKTALPDPAPTKILVWIPAAIVFFGLCFAISNFAFDSGGARHLDSQWLYVASHCIWDGQSPYRYSQFAICWKDALGAADPGGPFVFGPAILPIILPLGLWGFPQAAIFLDGINIVAVCLLGICLWLIADVSGAQGWHRVARSIWVAFGVSMGAISGAAYIGQPVIPVALGICLIYLGRKRNSDAMLAAGLLLCLIKPHISLLVLLITFLYRPLAQMRGKIWAGIFLLLILAATAQLNGNLIADYLTSLHIHSKAGIGHLASPETLYGFPGIIGSDTLRMILIIAAPLTCLMLLSASPRASAPLSAGFDALFLSAALTGPFLMSIKGYDLAVLAVIFALVARQPMRLQAMMVLPMLILWRPNLLSILGLPGAEQGRILLITGLCGLMGILWLGSFLALRLFRRQPGNRP